MATGIKYGIQRRLKFYFVFVISTQYTLYCFHRGQCVVSTEDIVSFPHRTMCGPHTGQCVVSTQDNVCCPHRTICVLHTGQCVVSIQDNVSCSNSTMCRVQTGHFDVAETNAPKRSRRNVHDETCTTKRARRNVAPSAPKAARRNRQDIQIFGRNKFPWPY